MKEISKSFFTIMSFSTFINKELNSQLNRFYEIMDTEGELYKMLW